MVFELLRRPWRRDADGHDDKQHSKKHSDVSAATSSSAATSGRKARPLSSRWGPSTNSHASPAESKAPKTGGRSSIGPGIASTIVPAPYLGNGASPTPTPTPPVPTSTPPPRLSGDRTRAISEPKLWPSAPPGKAAYPQGQASYPPRYLKAKDVVDPWSPTPDPAVQTRKPRPHIGPPKPQPALPVPPRRPPRPTHLGSDSPQPVQHIYDHLQPPLAHSHGPPRPRPLSMPPEAREWNGSLPPSRPASAPRPMTFHETHDLATDALRPPPTSRFGGGSPQPSAWRPQRLPREVLPPRQTSFSSSPVLRPHSAASSRPASPNSPFSTYAPSDSASAPGSPRFVTNAERPSRLRTSFAGDPHGTALKPSPLSLPTALAPSGPPAALHLPPGAQAPTFEYTSMPTRAARMVPEHQMVGQSERSARVVPEQQLLGQTEHAALARTTAPLQLNSGSVAESPKGRAYAVGLEQRMLGQPESAGRAVPEHQMLVRPQQLTPPRTTAPLRVNHASVGDGRAYAVGPERQILARPEYTTPVHTTAPLRVDARSLAESSSVRSPPVAQTSPLRPRRDIDVGRVLLPEHPPEYNPSWARDTDHGRPLKGGLYEVSGQLRLGDQVCRPWTMARQGGRRGHC